jgi:hypothetical protein
MGQQFTAADNQTLKLLKTANAKINALANALRPPSNTSLSTGPETK